MPQLRLTFSETIEVPEGTVVMLAPTGNISGFKTPDGTLIKTWLAFEHFKGGHHDCDSDGDLSYEDLLHIGIEANLDYERGIDVLEGDVQFVNATVLAPATSTEVSQ